MFKKLKVEKDTLLLCYRLVTGLRLLYIPLKMADLLLMTSYFHFLFCTIKPLNLEWREYIHKVTNPQSTPCSEYNSNTEKTCLCCPRTPNGPIRGAFILRPRSRYVKSMDWSKWTNPQTSSHTLNIFSAAAPPISPPWDGGTRRGFESVCEHTHKLPVRLRVCVCVLGLDSGWIRAGFRCVSLSRRQPLGS